MTTCNPQFDHLMNEVDHINQIYGYVGALEALIHIRDNIDEYSGTRIEREFREFMRQGARMFAPV